MFLCVSDESMQKCFGEGSGLVYQDVLSWLQSSNNQLQLSGALAIANFARNGEIFVLRKTIAQSLLISVTSSLGVEGQSPKSTV